ncbi:MAG: hypothetical protein Aurels2KO_12640 [Aureliella sp.]
MNNQEHATVPDQLREQLSEHLSQCGICQATLQELAEDSTGTGSACHDGFDAASHAGDSSTVIESRKHRSLNSDLPDVNSTLIETPTALGKYPPEPVAHTFPDPPRDDNHVGSVGRYQVKELVAHGGMSTVYSALDTVNERPVVLKVLSTWLDADPAARERIAREAEAAKRVRHPNVIAVYDFLLRDDLPPTVVMEQLSGNTLRHTLSDELLLDSRESASLLQGAARGLAACHEIGIVHRDVKPSNLLAETIDGERRLVVSDFGIALDSTHDKTLTKAGGLLGTPAYMSPEQILDPGSVDARSDVYSLGCVLYEMLTGRPPFLGSVRMLLWQATHETPRPPRSLNENVDHPLETICLKAIASNPAQRYPTAIDFADDLERYLGGKPIHARPAGPFVRFIKLCQRYPLFLTIAASLFVLLSGVSAVSVVAANRMSEARRKETSALEEASRHALVAEEQSELHKQAATVAEKQSQLAFDTMTQVIKDVEDGLSSLPQGSPIRKRLLETSLKSLDHAAEGFIDRSVINVHSARAMFELAGLHVRFGKPSEAVSANGNKVEKSAASESTSETASETADRLFTRAYEIAWKSYEEQGESLESLKLAQRIKSDHGKQLLYSQKDVQRAEQAIKRSLQLARLVLPKSEEKHEANLAIVLQLEMLSELSHRRNDFDEASKYLQESLAISEAHFPSDLPSSGETDLEVYEHKLIQYSLLAELSSKNGREEEAKQARKSALKTNLAIIAALEAQGDRGLEIAGQRIASVFLLAFLGDHRAAIAEGTICAEYLEEHLKTDPADLRTKQWLATTYSQIIAGHKALGEQEKATAWGKKRNAILANRKPSE